MGQGLLLFIISITSICSTVVHAGVGFSCVQILTNNQAPFNENPTTAYGLDGENRIIHYQDKALKLSKTQWKLLKTVHSSGGLMESISVENTASLEEKNIRELIIEINRKSLVAFGEEIFSVMNFTNSGTIKKFYLLYEARRNLEGHRLSSHAFTDYLLDSASRTVVYKDKKIKLSQQQWQLFEIIFSSDKPIEISNLKKMMSLRENTIGRVIAVINKKSLKTFRKGIISTANFINSESPKKIYWVSGTREEIESFVPYDKIPFRYELDPEKRTLIYKNKTVRLSEKEWRLFESIYLSGGLIDLEKIKNTTGIKPSEIMRMVNLINQKTSRSIGREVIEYFKSSDPENKPTSFWISSTRKIAVTPNFPESPSRKIPINENEWSMNMGEIELNPTLEAARYKGRYIVFTKDEWEALETIIFSPNQAIAGYELSILGEVDITHWSVSRRIRLINRKFMTIYEEEPIIQTRMAADRSRYYIEKGFEGKHIKHKNIMLNVQSLRTYAFSSKTGEYVELKTSLVAFYILKYLIESQVKSPSYKSIYEHLTANRLIRDGSTFHEFRATLVRQINELNRSYKIINKNNIPLTISSYGSDAISLFEE